MGIEPLDVAAERFFDAFGAEGGSLRGVVAPSQAVFLPCFGEGQHGAVDVVVDFGESRRIKGYRFGQQLVIISAKCSVLIYGVIPAKTKMVFVFTFDCF